VGVEVAAGEGAVAVLVLAVVEVLEVDAVDDVVGEAGEGAEDGDCGDGEPAWQAAAPRRATVSAETPRSRVRRARGEGRTAGVAGIVLEPIPPPLARAKP
jgi:hypothetical protein